MDRASVDAIDNAARTADVMKPLTDAISLSDAAINYFELGPGDSLSGGLHTHTNQEEIFYVLEGTATFDTTGGSHEVGADEIVRFEPGEYQEGYNDGDGRVRVLAMGAPQEDGETRTKFPCRECGADYHVVEVGPDGFDLECPDCGNEPDV